MEMRVFQLKNTDIGKHYNTATNNGERKFQDSS